MLTVHHLGISQSERIVWLCEELGLDYELKRYERDPATRLAPAEYKALHPIGTAPVITDGDLVLGESGAIMEYLAAKYGGGRFIRRLGDAGYEDYIYWFHYSNGSFQALLHRTLSVSRVEPPQDHRVVLDLKARLGRALGLIEETLTKGNYLAGRDLSLADLMIVFSLTTIRKFTPFDLKPYPAILAYLRRIGARDAYRRAMAKGDPGMEPLLDSGYARSR